MRPLRNALMAALRFCGVTPALARIFPGLAVLLQRESEQQPLDGDETVAGLLTSLLGRVEHTRQGRIEIDLSCATAADLGPLRKRRFHRLQRLTGLPAGTVDQTRPPILRGRRAGL